VSQSREFALNFPREEDKDEEREEEKREEKID